MIAALYAHDIKEHEAKLVTALENQRLELEQKQYQITDKRLEEAIIKLQPRLDPDISSKIAKSILLECKRKNLDPALITGLISVESDFNPFTESPRGAIGLMQVRYAVWKEEPELKENGVPAKGALYWIDRNIKAGTEIFRKYYEAANCDLVTTLYRYNTGSPTLPKDTSRWELRYVNKVLYHAYIVKTHLTNDNICEPDAENKTNGG